MIKRIECEILVKNSNVLERESRVSVSNEMEMATLLGVPETLVKMTDI